MYIRYKCLNCGYITDWKEIDVSNAEFLGTYVLSVLINPELVNQPRCSSCNESMVYQICIYKFE